MHKVKQSIIYVSSQKSNQELARSKGEAESKEGERA